MAAKIIEFPTNGPSQSNTETMARLIFLAHLICQEMLADGIADPLSQPVTIAAFVADCCRHLGVPLPPAITAKVG